MRPLCLIFFVGLICAAPARGLVTYGDDPLSLSAPANGAPWDHVAQVAGSASGVYLGNGFLLTAGHVNLDTSPTAPPQVFLNSAAYDLDRTYGEQGVQFLAGVDLKVLKITGNPGLPALQLTLAGEVDYGKSSLLIAWGTGKGAVVPDQGWLWGDDTTLAERWGTNQTSGYIVNDAGQTYLETLFNRSAGSSEAQVTIGDSGGGLFQMSTGGVWKLAGIADLAPYGHAYYDNDLSTPGDQPDAAYYLRVQTYRNQILAATGVPEPASGLSLLLGAGILALRPARRRGSRRRAEPA